MGRRVTTRAAILQALAESGPLTLTALVAECPQIPSANSIRVTARALKAAGLIDGERHGRGRGGFVVYRLAGRT